MEQERIRNFCIIAHIDHGKSTLADRLLESTDTIDARRMMDQVLDQMDLERERGITIKATAVRMSYEARDGREYELNLIDTPGHVDFTYEVSRSLAACEGALLVVDASQGIEAQTLANLYLALEQGLEIVPVLNKIDLPHSRPGELAQELEELVAVPAEDMILASAKEGVGTEEVLEAIVERIPPPAGSGDTPLRALIFDSHYDPHRGVVAYLRVVDGSLQMGEELKLHSSGKTFTPMEMGIFRPQMVPVEKLATGEVGYAATGLKEVKDCSVGDTITQAANPAQMPLPGYRPPKPMVFAGLYPAQGEQYRVLEEALEKLALNDAALLYEPETSQALGMGFRCGFLGLLHLEVVRERLEREHGLDLLVTAPAVEYQVLREDGEMVLVDNPAMLPPLGEIAEIHEPWMVVQIFTPAEHIGPMMELITSHRGQFQEMEYLDPWRVVLNCEIPLAELIVGFFDRLKSASRGYASLDYVLLGYKAGDLVKLEVLVNAEPVDALSHIVHRDRAYQVGSRLVERLKEVIPRQLFPVPIQASIGKRVIARETVRALRKNVLAKCYGGDVTRKRKLLERQREGRKRMKRVGKVDIPQEAFSAILGD
jgi:GTP-binding protein LepA